MVRDLVIERLRSRERELRDMGVTRLSLFGSIARGDDGPQSDVDIAVELDTAIVPAGLAFFGHLETLENTLKDIVGRNVDVVEEPARRKRFQDELDRDRIRAF